MTDKCGERFTGHGPEWQDSKLTPAEAQVATAWMLSKPDVTAPIIGATKPAHLEDALAAISLELTPEEIASLEAPYVPHPIAGYE